MNRVIKNQGTGEVILARARWCASYWCRTKGLMFRSRLDADEGLLFVLGRASKVNASIHMFFVTRPLGVVWIDADLRVVDAKLAKPWRPAYAPAKAAKYFIEARPEVLDRVAVGDVLSFEDA
jgi:uncharacterized membrane protein (UPF0127 family)